MIELVVAAARISELVREREDLRAALKVAETLLAQKTSEVSLLRERCGLPAED